MQLVVITVFMAVVFLLFKQGLIVLDRNVFKFQIDPVLKRGKITNRRDYKIVHNFIEMSYDKDPDSAEQFPKVKKLNDMMAKFHDQTHNQ